MPSRACPRSKGPLVKLLPPSYYGGAGVPLLNKDRTSSLYTGVAYSKRLGWRPDLEEINLLQPSGSAVFKALIGTHIDGSDVQKGRSNEDRSLPTPRDRPPYETVSRMTHEGYKH